MKESVQIITRLAVFILVIWVILWGGEYVVEYCVAPPNADWPHFINLSSLFWGECGAIFTASLLMPNYLRGMRSKDCE